MLVTVFKHECAVEHKEALRFHVQLRNDDFASTLHQLRMLAPPSPWKLEVLKSR